MGRGLYHTPDWKKALVTLKAGDKIQFFEGV
jgi:large subunit ribosomal protein L23